VNLLKVEDVFGEVPKFETDRLILRKMNLEDKEDVFEYASDPLVTAHTIWDYHKSIDDSIGFLKFMIDKYERHQECNWGIVYKENNKLIGTCGFVYWSPEHNRAEIGYALSRLYWNKGVMTEAMTPLMKFGFETMQLNRLEARCNIDNIGSERVMQKLGMSYEGVIREQLLIKGKFESVKLYSILKREYIRIQEGVK
jgi:[ribosomal protein S5]-alanine N-acetyltransferase